LIFPISITIRRRHWMIMHFITLLVIVQFHFEDVIQYEYCRAFMVNFCTAVYGRVFVGDI